MPMERMRVGISSERASQTTTPGPMEKLATKRARQRVMSQPACGVGCGARKARRMVRGCCGLGVSGASVRVSGFEFERAELAVVELERVAIFSPSS